MWTTITDTDGHTWLVSPTGQWVASFNLDLQEKEIDEIVNKLNS